MDHLQSLKNSLQNYSLDLTACSPISYTIRICEETRQILMIILWKDELLPPFRLNQLPTFHRYFTGLLHWMPTEGTAVLTVGDQMCNSEATASCIRNLQTYLIFFGWGNVPNFLGITQPVLKIFLKFFFLLAKVHRVIKTNLYYRIISWNRKYIRCRCILKIKTI